jgi:hypothetical protein
MWKCTLRLSALPKRWISVTAPHCALARSHAGLIRQPARDHPLHDAQHRADGLGFAGEQEAQGIRERSAPIAAPGAGRTRLRRGVSPTLAMRRAPQLGQKPRFLQENATSRSAWHCSHTTRRNP